MTTQTFDETKAEIFTDRILGVINNGALALMISIGHRTKLFDSLGQLPPSTSQEIADSTGLNERYVREWLGAMVTGRIIDYNATKKTYYLPPEHAAFLTRAAEGNNIAPITQFISVLGTVEDQIVDCFFQGGGVPYSQYKRFHEVMAEESAQTVVAALEEYILPLIPNIKEALEQELMC